MYVTYAILFSMQNVVQEARKANDIMKNINKHINKYDSDSEYLG